MLKNKSQKRRFANNQKYNYEKNEKRPFFRVLGLAYFGIGLSEVFQESRRKNFIPFEIKTVRQFVNTPDTWTNVARLHIKRGFWHQALDLLLVSVDKAADIDAQFGVEDYDREKLKDLWYDIYTCYDILEGTSKHDNKAPDITYLLLCF